MTLGKHRFSDLDTVIDCLHALFEAWEAEGCLIRELDDEILYRMKLAVHEWVANLVQHADFRGRVPDISLEVWHDGEQVQCVVEDNSEGFDLDAHLCDRDRIMESYPERGMGLLMLKACTSALLYRQRDHDLNRLEFSVSADQDPWLKIPF